MPKVEVDGIVSEEGFVESAKPGDIRLTVKADEATARALGITGVPFFVRTGKHLAARVTEIAIRFKCAPLALLPYYVAFYSFEIFCGGQTAGSPLRAA